jgi:hypothetical protein
MSHSEGETEREKWQTTDHVTTGQQDRMSGEVSTSKRPREETGVEVSAVDKGSEVFAGANNKMRKKTRSKQKNMRKDTYAAIFYSHFIFILTLFQLVLKLSLAFLSWFSDKHSLPFCNVGHANLLNRRRAMEAKPNYRQVLDRSEEGANRPAPWSLGVGREGKVRR